MRGLQTLTWSAAVLISALPIGLAQAAPIAPQGLGAAAEQQSVIDHVQFRWAGYEYCWYDDGWRGPGFYRCGFRLRTGLGWGGPAGWHGWRTGEIRDRDRIGVERRGVVVERGRFGAEERGRFGVEGRGRVGERGRVGVEERERVGERGRMSSEERSRVGTEGRARVGTEQRGRVGVEGGTTGRGGAATTTGGARERSGGGNMTSGRGDQR
jgi:hypothetical protein